MIKLYGFSSSNYYNIVKQTLLYKEIEFEEEAIYTQSVEKYLNKSPVGKVPCIETEYGFLSETTAILDYIEATYLKNPLYPSDAFAKAKVQEIMKISELYLELPARTLLPSILMGFESSDEQKRNAKLVLKKGVFALSQLVSFSPYIAGKEMTLADIYVQQAMSVTAMVAKGIFQWDIAGDISTMSEWLKLVNDTEISRKIDTDRKEDGPAFAAYIKALAK